MLWYTEYTAQASVTVPHFVRCAECGCQYVYETEYTGTGSGVALYNINQRGTRSRVRDRAESELAEQLADPRHYEPIPCPDCFRYQPYMRGAIAAARYDWLAPVGWFLLALGTIGPLLSIPMLVTSGASIVFWIFFGSGAAVSATGALVLLLRGQLKAGCRPNRGRIAHRERVARERAARLVAYQAYQARRVRRLYTRRRRRRGRRAGPPLTVDWWLPPSAFYGDGFVIGLSDDERVEVPMPSDAEPGDVVEVRPLTPRAEPFRVRLRAMRAHPGEYRLE
ncbi:hypothetical protein GobsT_03410 [Gemmata obscuriglobus]|uniref:Uncharacterized protein n=1 Tax=Gemmata obscuriglobus TaxID=114 RepID=A0A2Z3HHY4_9BACT|nr:hypothetical protein [Gemmata obscuriglobus]AWM41060.1 hypothetical protein C1280_31455 [Gemmata obscuriglobus]QEG25614.1 hypothetical protein GobsT_03410 [Gemmata obscuriglobus]VTR99112.1 unnamed protein product [Gemmata obscuriglobus UQM 2246]